MTKQLKELARKYVGKCQCAALRLKELEQADLLCAACRLANTMAVAFSALVRKCAELIERPRCRKWSPEEAGRQLREQFGLEA